MSEGPWLWSAYRNLAHGVMGRGLGLSRLPGISRLHSALVKRLRPNVADVEGHRLRLMARDTGLAPALAFYGWTEPLHTAIAKKEIAPGDVVLDLGANIGSFTLLFAKLAGPAGAVYAFEPAPETFEVLSDNVKENGYRNVTLVGKAVADYNGRAQLAIIETRPGMNHLTTAARSPHTAEVDVIRLDDFFADRPPRIDFIKMDIQGAELFALKGMPRLLDRNPRVKILTEFIPAHMQVLGADPEEYLRLLLDRGYDLFRLDQEMTRVTRPDTLLDPQTATDLFCVKP